MTHGRFSCQGPEGKFKGLLRFCIPPFFPPYLKMRVRKKYFWVGLSHEGLSDKPLQDRVKSLTLVAASHAIQYYKYLK